MAKVKLALRGKETPVKVQYARQVVTAMTGNPSYPNPSPALADVTAKTNAVEAKFNERKALLNSAQQRTTELHTLEGELDGLLTQLGNHVENASGGDEATIQSAGMEVRADAAPITDLPAPTDMIATVGDDDGEIDVDWDSVRGAMSYEVQQSLDATNWQHAAVSTRSKTTIRGLTSGTKYWFRVRAIGGNDVSPWSDPTAKTAP